MKYSKGYKYRLEQDYHHPLLAGYWLRINTQFIVCNGDDLTIKKGYVWDGASGPTFDTKSSMRGSLVHDALYQLIREGLLPESYRKRADAELERICIEDGMCPIRAHIWEKGVNHFGARHATKPREILEAP